jgi:hypothetical protein
MPVFAPTVPLGRIDYDAACKVLESCTPVRKKRALPYLLALYALINWWENYASWEVAPPVASQTYSQDDLALGFEPDNQLSWQMELSTTWCERPEIQELIDIADLTVQGVNIGIYPVDVHGYLHVHCPTLLGVIKADLLVGVKLDPQQQRAMMLGFLPTVDLLQWSKATPPDPHGFVHLPIDTLQPMHALPAQVSHLQLFVKGRHQTPHPEVPESIAAMTAAVLPKSNKNFTEPAVPNVKQVLQQLKAVGLSPAVGSNLVDADRIQADPSGASSAVSPAIPDEQVQRLLRAYQAYTVDAAEKRLTQQN